MAIRTALTERLGIAAPVLLAPMAIVSGGALAAAVSRAGGLGFIGGGYGDAAWMDEEVRFGPSGSGLFAASTLAKLPGHGIDDPSFIQPDRPMSAIGG